MLTAKKWSTFWIHYFTGCLIFLIPQVVLSFIFTSGFNYMGENTSHIFGLIFKYEPLLVFGIVGKVFVIILFVCLGLQSISSSFQLKYKLIFGFAFYLSVILRLVTIYPSLAENWWIVTNFPSVRNGLEHISSLPLGSMRREFLQWLPFLTSAVTFAINFIVHIRLLLIQNKQVRKAHFSVQINEFEASSKIFSITGVSFIVFVLCGGIFLSFLTSSFRVNLPENKTAQDKPNIFIFSIDSLRYDRLANHENSNVMPFLFTKKNESTFFAPMLVGIPRTFPSWVEIATGTYSLSTGVRTMFPTRGPRMDKKSTIFSKAKESGYSTLFVSDFAGDIFSRYPFGVEEVNAPTSNLISLVENGIINAIPTLQSVLILPSLTHIMPSLLESAEIADPRLLAHSMSESLGKVSHIQKPVFLTVFFSTAHFPYAAPGPWYSKFQSNDKYPELLFRKIPDQITNRGDLYLNLNQSISEKTKKQTIALYDGSLNSIDFTLEQIFSELEKKGWLKNSIILIFGDHGENLYDGALGMGHGDGVQGEYSNTTPLLIFTNGTAQPKPGSASLFPQGTVKVANADVLVKNLARTIDIAPTIAKRVNLPLDFEKIDGQSLLDTNGKQPLFSTQDAYMETGLWFVKRKKTPEGYTRISYPSIEGVLDIDAGNNYEFFLRNSYSQTALGVKERAWINKKYRLITHTLLDGVRTSLYFRTDTTASQDLLANSKDKKKYSPVAEDMLKKMNTFLQSRGIEIIKNSNTSFFYGENTPQ